MPKRASAIPQVFPIRFLLNSAADRARPYGATQSAVLNETKNLEAFQVISSWPEYHRTPLRELTALAKRLGVGGLLLKDEGNRFGQGSFKALGGAYGVLRALADRANEPGPGRREDVTVTCASEGNHGRSVAWGAARSGCRAVIYLPEDVSPYRKGAIEALGASVVLVEGTYDDAVRSAAVEAEEKGWVVVSDTSYPGCEAMPKYVMQGYTVLVREALHQLPPGHLPTHVFIQGGVGGLAAAVCGHLWETLGPDRPIVTVVEPAEADCLFESALVSHPASSRGSLQTSMSCLVCREPSPLAWEILGAGADAFVTIPDHAAEETVALLASPTETDPPVLSQPSGVAGFAGFLAALFEPGLATSLGLNSNSQVLLVISEGPAPGSRD